ncbi:MAG: Uma2 family endonuclease [Calditrichaeota bacterium]|nr:Uma2 family endonuclease [Calditrichota bacterium]
MTSVATNTVERLTLEDYRQLPDDGKRYEILEGELAVTPAPGTKHQRIVGNLFRLLTQFLSKGPAGEVFVAPLDVVLAPHTVVQPDLLFVSEARANIIREDGIYGAPDLVVEVLSPSTAERDRGVKRRLYLHYGVREVWLMDPEARTFEVVLAERHWEFRENTFTLPHSSVFAGSEIDLSTLVG